MRARLVIGSLVLVAACGGREETPPPEGAAPSATAPLAAIQLPADYIPGGVYGIDAAECETVGGAMTTDGNGVPFCSLGSAYKIFVCEGGLIVTLVERDAGRKVIHLSSGDFDEALPAAGEGEVWALRDYTVTIDGASAEFSNRGETVDCLPAASRG